MLPLLLLLFFIATFLIAAVVVMLGRTLAILKRKGKLESGDALGQLVASDRPDLLRAEELSSISFWNNVLGRFDFAGALKTRIVESGLDWSVGRLTAMMLLAGAIGIAVLTNISWIPKWSAVLTGAVHFLLPYAYVLRCRSRRFRKLEHQFPEAMDFLARALGAGHPLSAAMEMVAGQNLQPLSGEIRRAVDERNLGLQWDEALHNLAARVPIVEVSVFAAAVRLHSRAGGRLHEVLGTLAESMRESLALEGEVRAIASHGRVTGAVLTILPLIIVGIITMVNPAYFAVLLKHPNGEDMIAAALLCLVLAHFSIRRIVNIRI
jgi:tight adherence protein B